MNPHYPADSQPTPLFPPRTDAQTSNFSWSTPLIIIGILAVGLSGGLMLGLFYALFLGLSQGLLTGIAHGLIAGGIWAIIWYIRWSDLE